MSTTRCLPRAVTGISLRSPLTMPPSNSVIKNETVAGLGLEEAFGTLLIETEAETWIGLRHTAEGRFSAGFQAH